MSIEPRGTPGPDPEPGSDLDPVPGSGRPATSAVPSPGPTTPVAIGFYTRPGCPFSASLSRGLRRRGLPVEYRDIWKDRDAAAFVRSVARGTETVPTVVIGEVVLVNPSVRTVVAATAEHAPHLLPEPGGEAERGVRAWVRRLGRTSE